MQRKSTKRSAQAKKNISAGVKRHHLDKPKKYAHTCEKCGDTFGSNKKFKDGARVHCSECKRKVPYVMMEPQSILDLSKRTISKILKRSKKGCSICGWNKASCDIHHIVHRKHGGTNDNSNLIVVCPNCHREIHEHNPPASELQEKSIANTFKDWVYWYNPATKKNVAGALVVKLPTYCGYEHSPAKPEPIDPNTGKPKVQCVSTAYCIDEGDGVRTWAHSMEYLDDHANTIHFRTSTQEEREKMGMNEVQQSLIIDK